jgi:hypothetical protein
MLYGVWMARHKHRLAKAVSRVADAVDNPTLQRLLDSLEDWLLTSASKQAVKCVSKQLRKKK